ncbi:MAG: hypothetical protein J6T35_02035 [Bacteroidales bacterium]|nr:hypothetical protein [Bacteroidales bacterium]
MEERYFVVREDKERMYGSNWFTLMAFPNSLDGAKSHCLNLTKKEPNCKFMIAKVIMVADVNVDIKLTEV